jgi:hypothetical protein
MRDGSAAWCGSTRRDLMRIFSATALAACVLGTAAWAADPVGSYDVAGSNPGGNGSYTGMVRVEKTGETYKVTWEIAGTRYIGTALGDQRFLGVSYRTGNNTGLALYGEEGSDWVGVWTYAGGTELGKEKWTRR